VQVLQHTCHGGNVSFYNESPNASVYPTPVIGMLGLLDDASLAVTAGFKNESDVIIQLGRTRGHVGGTSTFCNPRDGRR